MVPWCVCLVHGPGIKGRSPPRGSRHPSTGTMETEAAELRKRSQVITGRPNKSAAQPAVPDRADDSSSPGPRRDPQPGGRGAAAPSSSGQSSIARADSNSFCPRCGSTSSVTSVDSGGGNRASLHGVASSSALQASCVATLMGLH